MEPGGTAAGALAHGLEQSGCRGGLMRDDESRCRPLIRELTSEQASVERCAVVGCRLVRRCWALAVGFVLVGGDPV
jgi:hypothetical protein